MNHIQKIKDDIGNLFLLVSDNQYGNIRDFEQKMGTETYDTKLIIFQIVEITHLCSSRLVPKKTKDLGFMVFILEMT